MKVTGTLNGGPARVNWYKASTYVGAAGGGGAAGAVIKWPKLAKMFAATAMTAVGQGIVGLWAMLTGGLWAVVAAFYDWVAGPLIGGVLGWGPRTLAWSGRHAQRSLGPYGISAVIVGLSVVIVCVWIVLKWRSIWA